jgi:LmbE family N-acetylglucosaminyl deacetylase
MPLYRRLRTFATAVCLAVATSVSSAGKIPGPAVRTAAFDRPLTRATRLLVISPHPDDAVLAAGGLIARVSAAHGIVHVVQMTSGDAFSKGVMADHRAVVPTADDYRRYGAARERETVEAMHALGVRRSSITFLGFPDDGLCVLAAERDARVGFESPYTKRRSPPVGEQVIQGVSYLGDDVRRELERVMARFAPTLVVVPAARDEHPDHCATHMFVRDALDAVVHAGMPRPAVFHYLIHFGPWPTTLAPGTPLDPPPTFPSGDGVWRTVALTEGEAARKQHALSAYKSQMLVIGDLVAAFSRRGELFLDGEPEPAPACWCRGENIATKSSRAR